MITKLSTYITDNTVPYRNLAVEEYLTMHTEPGECILFLWQNRRTVVIGKNQNCWKECRVGELERDGGYLVRRLSGGGAVFHDLGNLNFTFCVRREDYDVQRQLDVILQAARLLGVDARKTGRNDVTVDGRKFSGNAFYEAGAFCYHHGTLLLDVNKEDMSRYLNVSREKLQSKGVNSVRSRVVNLKELAPQITVPLMREKLVQAFGMVYGRRTENLTDGQAGTSPVPQISSVAGDNCWEGLAGETAGTGTSPVPQALPAAGNVCQEMLAEEAARTEKELVPLPDNRIDWQEIARNERRFASWEWKYGRRIPFQYSASRRFPWGDVELQFQVDGGIVRSANVFSDGMEPELVGVLPAVWEGCRFEEGVLTEALEQAAETVWGSRTQAALDEKKQPDLENSERRVLYRQMAEDIGALLRDCL